MNSHTQSLSLINKVVTLVGAIILAFALTGMAQAQSVQRYTVDGTTQELPLSEVNNGTGARVTGFINFAGMAKRPTLATTVAPDSVTKTSILAAGVVRASEVCTSTTAPTFGFQMGEYGAWVATSPDLTATADGVITYKITGLVPGEKYMYRTWVNDCAGLTYGTTRYVTTHKDAPAPVAVPEVTSAIPTATKEDETSAEPRLDLGKLFNKKDEAPVEATPKEVIPTEVAPADEVTEEVVKKEEDKAAKKAEKAAKKEAKKAAKTEKAQEEVSESDAAAAPEKETSTEATPAKKSFFQWLLKGNTSEAPVETTTPEVK